MICAAYNSCAQAGDTAPKARTGQGRQMVPLAARDRLEPPRSSGI